jgi:hypothetical protein
MNNLYGLLTCFTRNCIAVNAVKQSNVIKIQARKHNMKSKHMSTLQLNTSLNRSLWRRGIFLLPLVLACFGLSPKILAVVPAPDGGYPAGNTAEGQSALFSLTTGGFNTAIGYLSLLSNATNNFNTAVGAGTLLANTADQNTATGAAALLSNTTGQFNTANGAFALLAIPPEGRTRPTVIKHSSQ